MSKPNVKPQLDNRVKDAGYDLDFVRNVGRLDEVKGLVAKGLVKPEVYKELEDAVFKNQRKEKQKKKGMFDRFMKRATGNEKSEGSPLKTTFSKRNKASRSRTESMRSSASKQPKDEEVFKGQLLKFVKKKARKEWRPIHVVLYKNKVEFKRSEEDEKPVKTIMLTTEFFLSTCEGGVMKRAAATEDVAESDDEDDIRENAFFADMTKAEEVVNKQHVFTLASFNPKIKYFFAAENDDQRTCWLAMFAEVIRDLSRGSGDRKGSYKIWGDWKTKKEKFVQGNIKRKLKEDVTQLKAEDVEHDVKRWDQQGNKVATNEVVADWKSKEQEKIRKIAKENEELHGKLNEKELIIKQIREEKEEREGELRVEKQKNVEWTQKYEDLMVKYRAEALARNNERKAEEERIKKRMNALQRRSMIPQTEEAQYFRDELEKYKAKLETLQKALNVDLEEMNWDGTLEQAEERMQECLKGILEGETDAIQQKAQTDFDKWDQIVRSHKDYILREENKWQSWEEENKPKNQAALEEMRERFVPEEFLVGCSKDKLMELKGMKLKEAERVFKNKIFKFLWMPQENIAKLHSAALLNDYASQGLDIRELRAVYGSLPEEFQNDNDGKKKQFRDNLRARLFDLSNKEAKGTLSAAEALHNAYRDKAVKANQPRPAARREPRKKNAAMAGKAAQLEAFFNKQSGGAVKPKEKPAAFKSSTAKADDELNFADSKWKKYFNMQKMNLPDGAITNKMQQDGLDPDLWAKLKAAKESGGAPVEKKPDEFNPKAAEWQKYFKMQKMNLPDGAIKSKLMQDGKDPALWDKLKNSMTEAPPPKKKILAGPLNPDDAIWKTYFKMKKMGLEEGQIMNKMQQDDLDPNLWPKLCELREKKNQEKAKKQPDSLSPFETFAVPPKSQPKPTREIQGVKPSNTQVSEGSGSPLEEKEKTVTETMQEMMKQKKKKRPSKKKKKKSSKRISVADMNDEKKPSKRRGTTRKTLRGSKQEFHFLETNDLLDKMGLKDIDIKSNRNGSHVVGLMDIENKYGRGNNKRESVHKKPGRRKTLRKSKVGTGALQNDAALQEVIDVILTDGEYDAAEGGLSSMKFGEVFDKFTEISDVLVGLLLKGKKAKQIKYKGDMLFNGIHDEVKITVLIDSK